MKSRFLQLIAISSFFISLVMAANFAISGTIKTNTTIANLRVGIFAVDRNGAVIKELISVAGTSSFNLNFPDTAPPASSIQAVTSETIDFPGLLGNVKVTGQARMARAMLHGYSDADKSGSYTSSDRLLETTLTRGRGNMILVYAESKFRVQGDRGFDVTLEAGWNLVAIELGKAIEAKRVDRMDNVQLEIFAAPGY